MKIHPTAIISPRAEIADQVEIGAHAIIGGQVRIARGCIVQARAVIEGDSSIGENNSIGYGAVLGGVPQDLSFQDSSKSRLEIGTGNSFGEYTTVHRGTKDGSASVIGNHCRLMAGSHLGHNIHMGNNVTVGNNCLLGGYVEVGDGAVLGAGAAFHQFLRIGPLALVRAHTRFTKDIPPFVLAGEMNLLFGLNSSGLNEAGWPEKNRAELKRAFRLVYASRLNISQALEKGNGEIWSATASVFFDFIASSKRGVCTARRGGKSLLPKRA